MVRVALIGLGSIAEVHIPILQNTDRVQLCAACDIDQRRSNMVPGVPFYTNHIEMIEKETPDCVQLCLPHWLHYPIAKDAVERGIHVFTEKPVALNPQEAYAFAVLEKAHPDICIGLCFQNRYNTTTEVLKMLIDSGNYGKIQNLKGLVIWSRPQSYYETAPWRGKMATSGGGVMINQAIHTLDLMTYLCGKVSSVKGSICQLLDYGIEVEDTAAARLAFENGAIGTFYATVAHGENTNVELAVTLERGKFIIQDDRLYQATAQGKELLAENQKMDGEKFYYGSSHAKLIELFYEDLEQGTCRYPKAADGIASLEIIEAIRQSSQQGKKILL